MARTTTTTARMTGHPLSPVGVGLVLPYRRQFGHAAMMGRQVADRVGRPGIAREQEGLAAAAAKILLPAGTAPARFAHPVGAAEGPERRRVAPDVGERVVAHRPE